MNVDPAIARPHGFPFLGLIHLGNRVLIHGKLVLGQARGAEKATPVHECGVDALFLHGGGVGIGVHALVGGHAEDFHLTGLGQCDGFGETGGKRLDLT